MSKYLLAFLTATTLAACTEDPADPIDPPPPVSVESIEVDAPPHDLLPGQTAQLTARALDADGRPVADVAFTWESDNPTVATVGADGLVTALAVGEVTISASAELVTGGVFLTVLEDELPAVAYVELEPSGDVELAAGATLQLSATAYASDGSVLTGRAFRFETSAAAVATVTDGGLVTAVAPGEAYVRVICESQRADLVVRVPDLQAAVDHVTLGYTELLLPVGHTMVLVAQPRDAQGQPLDRAITWSSNNPSYVSVDATGRVTALEAGGADVTATSEGKSASVLVYATATTTHGLVSVGGNALPAPLGSFTSETSTHTIHLRDGSFTIDHTSGTYEAVLHGTIATTGQTSWVPLPVTYASSGSVERDAAGGFTFVPVNFGAAFHGTWLADGLQVVWQPDTRIAGAVTLRFTND